jgi:hypothetical protein
VLAGRWRRRRDPERALMTWPVAVVICVALICLTVVAIYIIEDLL